MFERFFSSVGFVGVDFGTRGIKMLQVRERAGKLDVIGAARIDVAAAVSTPGVSGESRPANADAAQPGPRHTGPVAEIEPVAIGPGPEALSEQIRAAFAAGRFTGRRCVVCLAREDVRVQSIRLPKMPDDELRQTAAWEAAQRFNLDRNAMEVDFIRTGATLSSGENRDEVILIAASRAAINARLEPVLAAGLRPVAVDTAFTALVRTFSRHVRREADLELVRVVVEIGASGSTVLILRGDQIAFCKPLSISGSLFNRAVAEHLHISESDAGELRQARIGSTLAGGLAATSVTDPATERAVYAAVRPLMGELVKEITLCLRYYGVTFRGQPPQRIVLTGGDALEPKLDETIAKSCKLQVSFDDAPAALSGLIGSIQSSLNRQPGPAASWASAMGLSLRGIEPKRIKRAGAGLRQDLKEAA